MLIVITSCNQQGYDEELLKKQITDMTNDYNKVWETLNVEKIATSNAHLRKIFPSILSNTKEFSMKTLQPVVQVLNKHAAIISFIVEAEIIETDGKKLNETGALTYVWNNIDGEWKIIHIHESGK